MLLKHVVVSNIEASCIQYSLLSKIHKHNTSHKIGE